MNNGVALALVMASGCADDNAATTPPPDDLVQHNLTDGQISNIVDTANIAESDQAVAVLPLLAAAPVVRFAEEMIDDHTFANVELAAVMINAGATLEESPLARDVEERSLALMAALMSEAPPLDAFYLEAQVDAHARLLLIIDTQLLVQAESPRLQRYLTALRNLEVVHLGEAERLAGVEPTVE